jgi:cob(I)alamin adenosyltransferase
MTHTTTDRLLESARSTQAQQPPVKSSPVHPGTAVFEVARSGVRKVYRALVQGTPREPQGHVRREGWATMADCLYIMLKL